jgi:hypothetical protein
MMETKRRREQRSMLPVHPDAAAIDIGATVHVAAVGPARDPQPVRSFGTFTGDLHRLADWFAQCGIKTVVMEPAKMPRLRRPKPDRRPALELLASCRDGCTEAIMLAHGFSIDMMVELVNAGVAPPPSGW